MYVIREVVNCRPGKVGEMVDRFRALSRALEALGRPPLRLLTDVSGEPFWTVVAEAVVDRVDDFFALERTLRGDATLRETMASYHDLVATGRREIYRVDS